VGQALEIQVQFHAMDAVAAIVYSTLSVAAHALVLHWAATIEFARRAHVSLTT